MKKIDLTFDQGELHKYLRINRDIIDFHHIASNDYVAYRCCYFNNLFDQAYIFAAQAIEKELKLILLFVNPSEDINNKKFKRHNIESLIQRIQKFEDLNLTQFQSFGKRLFELYDYFRYPGRELLMREKTLNIGGDEINKIDEFFFYLMDISPLPEEVLFSTGIMSTIFENMFVSEPMYYATHRNGGYRKRHHDLSARFHNVKNIFILHYINLNRKSLLIK